MDNRKIIFCLLFALASVLLLLTSCNKDENSTQPFLGYSYYPDEVGRWIIYDVDSIYRDPFFGTTSHVKYQVMEIIDSVFMDNQNRPTLRIERYRNDSLHTTPNWVILNVWTANRTGSLLERFENNIRFVKFIFPPDDGKSWNGNSMNTLDEQLYENLYVHQSELIGSINFDSVTQVLHVNDTDYNILFPRYEFEKFAAGVGMVEKRIQQIDFKVNQFGQLDTSMYLYYEEKVKSFGE